MQRRFAGVLLAMLCAACEPSPSAQKARLPEATKADTAAQAPAPPKRSSPATPSAGPSENAAPSASTTSLAAKPANSGRAEVVAPQSNTAAGAEAFFKEQIQACNAWNVKVGNASPGEKMFPGDAADPSTSLRVGKQVRPKVWEIEDRNGTRLLVDLEQRRITSPRGARGEMPAPYRFCDEKVFVGTSD